MSFEIIKETSPEGALRFLVTKATIFLKEGKVSKLFTLLYDCQLNEKDKEIVIEHLAKSFLSEKSHRVYFYNDKWYILRSKVPGEKISSDNLILAENQVKLTKTKLLSIDEE